MRSKPIDKLYGLSAILILVLLLAKYLDQFPVPSWLLGGALIFGVVTFFLEVLRQRSSNYFIGDFPPGLVEYLNFELRVFISNK